MQPEYAANEYFFTSNLEHIKIEVSRSREEYISEHFHNYSSPDLPPVWKTLEVVSFGTLSKLYSNFHDATAKHLVAREFGLNHHKFLRSWMEMLSVLRNYCAHHARVWNRRFPIKPQMPVRMPNAWITNMSFPCESLYPQLCCIAYWLNSIYLRISPKWYRCIGLLVPCGAEAWYRTYRFDGTGTKVPIYTLSKGALRTVPHGTLR